jgi:hypothetical protein
VQERSRRSAGDVKALDAEGLGGWTLTALLKLPDGASLIPKIFSVSKRADSETTKHG